MTRKVVQNTRPLFSHVRGGAGHETRHGTAVAVQVTDAPVLITVDVHN